MNTKSSDNGNQEKEKKNIADSEYRFMDQVIRKKPIDWKKIIIRFVWIVIAGVLIGMIAACVLVQMVPELKEAYASHKLGGTITISQDEDPSSGEAVVAGSSDDSSSVSVSGSSASEEAANAAETLTGDSSGEDVSIAGSSDSETDSTSGTGSSSEEAGTEEAGSTSGAISISGDDSAVTSSSEETEEGITLDEYGDLYQQMADLSDEVGASLVQVTGISNEMDYFDQGYVTEREATGLIIAENSTQMYILTEYRVIDGAESIQVTMPDQTMVEAHLRKQDTNTGLCILYIPLDLLSESTKSSCVTASLGNSYSLQKGDPVLALGSPAGYSDSVAFGAVTSVSSNAYLTDNVYPLLATDIKGAAGGSGVLVNMDGSIVGIIDQSLSPDGGETVTALAISGIKSLIESLSNNEPIPYLGITGQDVTNTISEQTSMPVGLLVTNVADDSPAMLAGLKTYDVITEISGREIRSFNNYHTLLSSLKPGDVITVTAMRKGADGYSPVTFSVTVGEQ